MTQRPDPKWSGKDTIRTEQKNAGKSRTSRKGLQRRSRSAGGTGAQKEGHIGDGSSNERGFHSRAVAFGGPAGCYKGVPSGGASGCPRARSMQASGVHGIMQVRNLQVYPTRPHRRKSPLGIRSALIKMMALLRGNARHARLFPHVCPASGP